jgi:hypothetical protein
MTVAEYFLYQFGHEHSEKVVLSPAEKSSKNRVNQFKFQDLANKNVLKFELEP